MMDRHSEDLYQPCELGIKVEPHATALFHMRETPNETGIVIQVNGEWYVLYQDTETADIREHVFAVVKVPLVNGAPDTGYVLADIGSVFLQESILLTDFHAELPPGQQQAVNLANVVIDVLDEGYICKITAENVAVVVYAQPLSPLATEQDAQTPLSQANAEAMHAFRELVLHASIYQAFRDTFPYVGENTSALIDLLTNPKSRAQEQYIMERALFAFGITPPENLADLTPQQVLAYAIHQRVAKLRYNH